MNRRALQAAASAGARRERLGEHVWLAWLGDHLDLGWRPGEWDHERWLFTGDLASDRTAAWPCATPGCPVATRYHHRRCDGCRRARLAADLSWEELDAAPFRRPVRPPRPRRLPGARLRERAAQPRLVFAARAFLAQGQGRAGRGVHRPGPAAGPPRRLRRRRLRTRAGQPPQAVPVPRQPAAPPARRGFAAGRRTGRLDRRGAAAAGGAPVLPGRPARVAAHRVPVRAATARPGPAAAGPGPGADPARPAGRGALGARGRPRGRAATPRTMRPVASSACACSSEISVMAVSPR